MNTGNNDEKDYYNISEVSALLQVKPTVLRFWETEFENLKPIKNKLGHRLYTKEDIDTIIQIKNLLYDKSLTIKKAKYLINLKNKIANPKDLKNKLNEVLKILKETKTKRNINMEKNARNNNEQLLINKVIDSGNEHIFTFWNELNNEEKDILINEINKTDFNKVIELFNTYKNFKPEIKEIQPSDYLPISEANDERLKKIGEKALKAGEIGFLTVAGGQGSRLDYEHPKGCFPISPVKQKSLFRIFAEKIKFYSDYYKNDFYWFIMTSESNNEETITFFEDNNYFNLNKKNVVFFTQGQLPTLTLEGKLILSDKNKLFLNPDGHGGIIKSLSCNKILQKMKDLKIKHLSYFQVDNPLVKIADSYFIGYHINKNSDVSSKVIPKTYPEEKIGAICKYNNKNTVIEYSDLSEKNIYEKNDTGALKYLMGSIAIHIFKVDFLIHASNKMPYHFAVKNVKGYSFNNKIPEITEFKGLKFEHFVFDIIPMADNSIFFETDREEEFYPLKNKTGNDSIETCIKGQNNLHLNWLQKAKLINNEINNITVEISPLYAPDEDIFLNKIKKDFDKINRLIYTNGKLNEKIYIE